MYTYTIVFCAWGGGHSKKIDADNFLNNDIKLQHYLSYTSDFSRFLILKFVGLDQDEKYFVELELSFDSERTVCRVSVELSVELVNGWANISQHKS